MSDQLIKEAAVHRAISSVLDAIIALEEVDAPEAPVRQAYALRNELYHLLGLKERD